MVWSVDDAFNESVPPHTPSATAAGTLTVETLTIISRNAVNPLAFVPLGAVEFEVNGIESLGITNVGTTVTIDPAVNGFNIDPGVDVVKAQYLR